MQTNDQNSSEKDVAMMSEEEKVDLTDSSAENAESSTETGKQISSEKSTIEYIDEFTEKTENLMIISEELGLSALERVVLPPFRQAWQTEANGLFRLLGILRKRREIIIASQHGATEPSPRAQESQATQRREKAKSEKNDLI